MVYGGYVLLPGKMSDIVTELLSVKKIRLGRSKKVQYGTAAIRKVEKSDYQIPSIQVKNNEVVFAILKSDLVFQENAGIHIDNDFVRRKIAEAAGLNNILPEGFHDICRYHVLSGYNTMWQMQKPKIQAVMGGSVYCFSGTEREYASRLVLGEYQQEGMGIIELVSFEMLKSISEVKSGRITVKTCKTDHEAKQRLENALLYGAALEELREYAFKFSRKQAENNEKQINILKEIPAGRLRQMLQDSCNIGDLWNMVNSMRISDVSSESRGKLKASQTLLEEFYGTDRNKIDFDRLLDDRALLEELQSNKVVFDRVKEHWKEALFTLLHMVHYRKGGKQE